MHRDILRRDPVDRHQQCLKVFAEHTINTERAEYTNTQINHIEGGWPKDVNMFDEEQTKRYRRKVEKDENYFHIMMSLFKVHFYSPLTYGFNLKVFVVEYGKCNLTKQRC